MSSAGPEEDQDKMFLDQVLNRLYDFGDASKKNLKSGKKKKRKSCEVEERDEEQDAVTDPDRDVTDSGEQDAHVGRGSSEVEPTGRAKTAQQVEVVTFRDPTKRAKTKHTPTPHVTTVPQKTEVPKSDKTEQLSLEKARLEVHRFGITGYRKEQQRVFEQDRAIMLGARPPKKEYVNYKVLQQQLKEKKQKSKEEAQLNLKKNKKKQSKPRDKKRSASSSGSGSGPSGQVGRFKNGVLILSHQEIQKIKGNKGRK